MTISNAYENHLYLSLKQSNDLMRSAVSHAYSVASAYLRDWAGRQVDDLNIDTVSPWREALGVDTVETLVSALNLPTTERLLQRVVRELNVAWQTRTQDPASVFPFPPVLDASETAIYFMKKSTLQSTH